MAKSSETAPKPPVFALRATPRSSLADSPRAAARGILAKASDENNADNLLLSAIDYREKGCKCQQIKERYTAHGARLTAKPLYVKQTPLPHTLCRAPFTLFRSPYSVHRVPCTVRLEPCALNRAPSYIPHPPHMGIAAAVMKEASSDARKAMTLATSSGSAIRPRGVS